MNGNSCFLHFLLTAPGAIDPNNPTKPARGWRSPKSNEALIVPPAGEPVFMVSVLDRGQIAYEYEAI
jgi:hypothetical protein